MASRGAFSVGSKWRGMSLRKNHQSMPRVAAMLARFTGHITEAYSPKPIPKKSAETMFTRFDTTSGRLAVSAMNPAAMTNARVAAGEKRRA